MHRSLLLCVVVSGPDSGVVFAAASAVRDLWLAGHCEMQVRLTAGLIMPGLSTQCSSSTSEEERGLSWPRWCCCGDRQTHAEA